MGLGNQYVLILGGTGAIGSACALKLAKEGFGVILIYRERRFALNQRRGALDEIEKYAVDFHELNMNINETLNEQKALNFITEALKPREGRIALLLDAVADANINSLFGKGVEMINSLSVEDIFRTIKSMGIGVYRWTSLLMKTGLLSDSCRVLGLTSVGTNRTLEGYAATASAKAVLEMLCKYMAVELKGNRMTSNLIRSGLIETEALRQLPESGKLLVKGLENHPKGRLTRPEDVANVVSLLMRPEADWINGTIIEVDGGERLVI